MELYDCQMAPNPRRARIFIAEKKIDIKTNEISIIEGENLKEDYLKINPWGLLPSLVVDEKTVITEVPSIFLYLESLHPEPNLLGKDLLETINVQSWERFSEMNGMQAVGEFFRNQAEPLANRGIPGFSGVAQVPELVGRGKKRADWYYAQLNSRLHDSEYVAGTRYTAADITALCVIDFGKAVGLPFEEGCEHINRWYNEVSKRPSSKV